ncbi:MAG: HD domain-containing protein [Anaerolineaceae bacterium]|nr:HD domain-containing protein [Anaerolineaceae bacterium]
MPTLEQARAWYIASDPVHDFEHVQRVYNMAERLAIAEGADLEIVRAAALLHDAQGTTPGAAIRAVHQHSSAEFARQVLQAENWSNERIAAVQHCIRAHRYRDVSEPPATIEAKVLFDADKLDVLGAIGVARVIAYASLAGEPFYAEPSQHFLQTGQKDAGEPHSAYHEYLFKLSKIKDRLFTQEARRIAADRDVYLAEYFQRLQDELQGKR